jgi:hypothetical protein
MKLPKMVEVESSNVVSIGYDKRAEELFVEFKGGAIYMYSDVPKEEFDNLMKSESVGNYIRLYIQDSFFYERIDHLL